MNDSDHQDRRSGFIGINALNNYVLVRFGFVAKDGPAANYFLRTESVSSN